MWKIRDGLVSIWMAVRGIRTIEDQRSCRGRDGFNLDKVIIEQDQTDSHINEVSSV